MYLSWKERGRSGVSFFLVKLRSHFCFNVLTSTPPLPGTKAKDSPFSSSEHISRIAGNLTENVCSGFSFDCIPFEKFVAFKSVG